MTYRLKVVPFPSSTARRCLVAAVSVAVVVGSAAGVAAAPDAATSRRTTLSVTAVSTRAAAPNCPTFRKDWRDNPGDLTNDGQTLPELIVGSPHRRAGAVDIGYDLDAAGHVRTRRSLPEKALVGPTTRVGDEFGSAIELVDLDGDLCTDLAIGAPGADNGRGAVVLAHSSPDGPTARGGVTRLVGRSPHERFGSAIAWSWAGDLWIGAPDRAVAGQAGAGAVDQYKVSEKGVVTFIRSITQDTPGIPGSAEAGDHFGTILQTASRSLTLAVGVPKEDLDGVVDAGVVTVFSVWNDPRPKIRDAYNITKPASSERGDEFGAALAYVEAYHEDEQRGGLAIGIPGARVGSQLHAGAVYFASDSGYTDSRMITQDSPGVPGTAETGDRFGSSVSIGQFASCVPPNPNDPDPFHLTADIAIGAPYEDLDGVKDAGAVAITGFDKRSENPVCTRSITRGRTGGLGGTMRAGDKLGASLTVIPAGHDTGSDDQLFVGAPGVDVGGSANAGVAIVTAPSAHPIHATYSDSASAVPGAGYGALTVPSLVSR